MQGHLSVYFKNGEALHFNRVHYLKYSYELEAAEVGYSEYGNCLIKSYRLDLKTVERIVVK